MRWCLLVLLVAVATCAPARRLRSGPPDPGQKTRQGCTCTSQCGATVDFGESEYDWCDTADKCGMWSFSHLTYYDYCVYPANVTYESQTAATKLAYLWGLVSEDPTGGRYPSTLELAGLLTESVKTTFDDVSDHFPAGRIKYIHSVGAVCQFSFEAVRGTHYTGVFKGAKYGLIRMSAAKALTSTTIVPGFGIKFLRDGRHSASFMAMPSLDGQSDFNFFHGNFTNHPAFPKSAALQALVVKFGQASNCPLRVGLADAASFDAEGNPATNVTFPWEIVFIPTGLVTFPSEPYDQAQLGRLFGSIPPGTRLFDVYGYDSPVAKQAGLLNPMGSVTTATQCVTSTYGDQQLFFKHEYSENDFKIHPEWLQQIDDMTDCGTTKISPVIPP